MAIRPPADDLYRELGIGRAASPEELSAAFRRRAKELHPDAQTAARNADPRATEEFKRISRAYAVLRDPAQRARYDAQQPAPAAADARVGRPAPSGARPPTAPVRPVAPPAPRRWTLTRRTARRMVASGIALVVLGLVAGAWVVTVQRSDAELRARGIAAVATVVDLDGRHRLQFTTRAGDTIVGSEATKTGSEGPPLGSTVGIHYDRNDPTLIVADGSHTARDVTLWIVAIKFVVGGAVLVWVGTRRLRR